MDALQVSPTTVQNALISLAKEGVLEIRPGKGSFVLSLDSQTGSETDVGWQSLILGPARIIQTDVLGEFGTVPLATDLVLNAGYPPTELQPLKLIQKAAARALMRPNIWARMPIEGAPELRAWFANETVNAFEPHHVVICPGTQSALSAAFRALASPGDPIIMESPTYGGAIAAAAAVGLQVIPVPTDVNGVNTELLDEAFRRSGARLFYCQPCYANPTGAVLEESRRRDVIDIIEKYGAFLIEDDWARDFQLASSTMPAPLAQLDRHGHVVYIRSLTKCSAPGLRVGAICARGPGFERLRLARLVDDFFVPGILQQTTLEMVTAASWPSHLRFLRSSLRKRRDTLAEQLQLQLGADCLMLIPDGGLHLWVKLPPGISDRDVQMQAQKVGVLVSPGYHWFPGEPPGGYLRLTFAAAQPENVASGVRKIARIVQDLLLSAATRGR